MTPLARFRRAPFEPLPEDAEVLDSILDYPIEPGSSDDDHDDATQAVKAPAVKRLLHRLRHGTTDGE